MHAVQSVFSPASPQAAAIAQLTQFFIIVAGIVWIVVLGFLAYAVLRPKLLAERASDIRVTRHQLGTVGGALGLTTVLLIGLGFLDYGTGRSIETGGGTSRDTLQIRLVGRQWWWQIEYQQRTPPYRVVTANEMHIPLHRPVLLTLESSDVIHSFWAPNLHGKADLIPSYKGALLIQADSAGVYRAPCAEYCGDQHANMTLLIIAQPANSFASWYQNQMRDAPPSAPSLTAARGQEVFQNAACPFCHTIRGAATGGSVAPDLTHLATRTTLAAGSIQNSRGELAAWIANPQAIKPGNRMPANLVTGSDLNALLDYLATLK